MCSDRPKTKPKSLDLVVSPTCLREKERESLLEVWCGLVGKRKGTLPYKSDLADPTILSRRGLSALPLWTVRLSKNLIQQPTGTASGELFPTHADCPRTYGGPSVHCSVANHRCIRSLPDEPMISGPSAVLWRTVRNVILQLRTFLQSL